MSRPGPGPYTPVYEEVEDLLSTFDHSESSTGSATLSQLVATDTTSLGKDYLAFWRGMMQHSDNGGRGQLLFSRATGSDFGGRTRGIAAGTTLVPYESGTSTRRVPGDDANPLQIEFSKIVEAEPGTTAAKEFGIVGIDISNLTEDVDYFVDQSSQNISGESTGTDVTLFTHSVNFPEAGDYLIFWQARYQRSGLSTITGTFGFRFEVDGVDPYNVVSGSGTVDGFRLERDGDRWGTYGGVVPVSLSSSGTKDIDFIIHVDTDSGIFTFGTTVIPVNRFANVSYTKITDLTSTTSSSFAAATGASLGSLTYKRPTLILFSAPCQVQSEAGIRTKFVSDGSADLTDGDDFGHQQGFDIDGATLRETFPFMNFVLVDSLDSETISVQTRRLGGEVTDVVVFNCRDDGTSGSNAYLIAIELATLKYPD